MTLANTPLGLKIGGGAGDGYAILGQPRHALRDVPAQPGFPDAVIWPEEL